MSALLFPLLEMEKAIASLLVESTKNLATDVAVLRYPQRPVDGQGQGDAGRPAAIYVGFREIEAIEIEENSDIAVTAQSATLRRGYQIVFNLVLETYEYVDPDHALEIIPAVLSLDGHLLSLLSGARPLLVNLAFDSHEEGYWLYEGEITVAAYRSTDVVIDPKKEVAHPVRNVRVGVWAGDIGTVQPHQPGRFTLDVENIVERT